MSQSFDRFEQGGPTQTSRYRESAHKSRAQGDPSSLGDYTVTKSEPNEASLWKITLQKRENSHVNAGTFIQPVTLFLYILLCGKSVPVYGREHFTGLRR
jgi:hypothetical protein